MRPKHMDRGSLWLLRTERFLLTLIVLLSVDLVLCLLRPVVGEWWWLTLDEVAMLEVGVLIGAGVL